MQGTHGGSAYGVKYQARCISSVIADAQQTSFIIGTLSLREENEVHLIKYNASTGDVTCEGLYAHQQEVWDLASCPFDPSIFSIVHASAGDFGASVWKLPDHEKRSSQLEKLADLNGHTKIIKCTRWSQSMEQPQLLSIDDEALYVWNIDVSGRSVQVDKRIPSGLLYHMTSGAWDPHNTAIVAGISDACVQFWDLRSTKQVHALENAHARDLDFNPQKQNIFATVGYESQIRLWDQRMLGRPLLELPGHSHWTWRVQYNPKCDAFLLSSGTDSLVNLWNVNFSNEDKMGSRSPEDSPRAQVDPLLRSYTGHEDSVYGIAWSFKEPWIFASLSYDGRVLVDSVPHHVATQIKSAIQ